MAKRSRVTSESEDEYHSAGTESDADFSAGPSKSSSKSTARVKAGTNPRATATRIKKLKPDPDVDADNLQTRLHHASQHTIVNPVHLRSALLNWYAGAHALREMPWRKSYDPSLGCEARAQRAYEVWISEIMLQQTQVVTVIPYYNRWMDKFPTIKHLASSDIETVNSLWKGLGYYSRAARLLAGAKKAVNELGGRLPDNARDMEAKIPGIGRYSAGAICSIAYGECVPVLDGNVHRLLSRVLALHAPPKAKPTLDILWAGATAMVGDADTPGDVNQALIELGSTVCKVRDPTCATCPLQEWCSAYQGRQAINSNCATPDIEDMCTLCEPLPNSSDGVLVTVYPMKVDRKKARDELDIVNVIEWRSSEDERWFLLVRRPEGGLLAGLYEFPTSPNVAVTSAADLAAIPHALLSKLLTMPPQPYSRTERRTTSESVVKITAVKPAGDVIHVFSHIKKTYRVQWVVLEGGGAGDGPPALVPGCVLNGDEARERKGKPTKKTKTQRKPVGVGASEVVGGVQSASSSANWIPVDEVADANIGTGVLKVWNQVKNLWEGVS